MLRNSLFAIIFAAVALIAISCTVTPETYPVAKVGSHVITLKQVENHPMFKNLVDEFILKQVIEDTAASKGIKIADEKVNQEFEKTRKDFGGEEQFKDMLAQQGMTEVDVKDQIKSRLLLFELLKSGETVTDTDAKAEFDANPDYYRRMYATEKNLTVDEAQNLKFEDMKDYLIDQMRLNRAYPKAQKMIDDLKAKASVE
jgi:parvulin-like peptidyl-prolyl isomerase